MDGLSLGRGRGPISGFGANAQRPWNGIVEETRVLWVTWLAQLARLQEVPVTSYHVEWGGVPIPVDTVRLTYGARAYFRCPRCGRRCEAVYLVLGRSACRKCQRLGYRSQAHRPGSLWRTLERIFDRDMPIPHRYQPNSRDITELLNDLLRRKAEVRITQTVNTLNIR